jgi:hypothetical protein
MTPGQKYIVLKDAIYTLKNHVGQIYKLKLNEMNFDYICGQYWTIDSIEQAMVQIELSDKSSQGQWWALIQYICKQYQHIMNCEHDPGRNGRIFVLEALITTIDTLEKEV